MVVLHEAFCTGNKGEMLVEETTRISLKVKCKEYVVKTRHNDEGVQETRHSAGKECGITTTIPFLEEPPSRG